MSRALLPFARTGVTRSGSAFRGAAANALAAVAGTVARRAVDSTANYLYNTASGYWTGNSNSRSYRIMRARSSHGRRRGRRMFRARGKRRRFQRRKRGVRNKMIAGKGPYQRGFRRFNRTLNTKMLRNDYDSTREIKDKGVVFARSTGVSLASSNTAIGDYPLAASKMFDYDEYQLKNIQLVLTPLHISNGAEKLELADAGEPYIYVVPKIHPEAWTSTPSLNTLKSTPGVMRFHMLRTKPIVVNLSSALPRVDEIKGSTTGASYTIEQPGKYYGWIHQPQTEGPIVDANYPNFGNVQLYIPQIQVSSFQPKWRVDYYATVLLRGNRALAEV